MLTNKNWVPRAFSAIRSRFLPVVAACLTFLLVGCQPPGPKSLLLGEKYLEQGDYHKALKHLSRAAELMDEHPQVWNHLGLAYHGLNQPAKAVEAYQRAIRIDRNLPAPHYNLGLLLLEQDHLQPAVAELNTFVNLQTNSSQGWTKLGTALVRMKRPDDAERALQIALRIEPKNAEAHNNLGLAHLQRKRHRDAMLAFNSALQSNAAYAPAVLNQAVVAHQHFGNKELALERYRAYLSTKPDAQTAAQVQQAIASIEKEMAGVEIAQAVPPPAAPTPPPDDPPVIETNSFTAMLRSNLANAASSKPVDTNQVAQAKPPTNATNLAARIATPKTNAISSTNVLVAAAPATNTAAPVRSATNEVAAVPKNTPPASTPASVRTNTTVAAAANTRANPKADASTAETTDESKREPGRDTTTTTEPEPIPVEVVSVDSGPAFKPAADFVEPGAVAANTTTTPAPAPEEKPLIIPRRERKEEDKPGFFSKMNPVRWFKDEDKPVQQAMAKTAKPEETAPKPPPTYRPPITPPNPQPEAPRVIPRYQYRKNIPLKAGDRAIARKVFQQGVEAHQKRRLAEAMAAYQNASTIDPSYYDAYYNLGLAAYQSKNLPLALAANELAIAAQPGSADARYNFALTLRDANYPADAANELNTLLESRPEDIRAHFALANIYAQQLDQPALARKHYLAVLELNSSHPGAPQIRQWLASSR
jgi:tetratricopeptide (TPR) repeat protein